MKRDYIFYALLGLSFLEMVVGLFVTLYLTLAGFLLFVALLLIKIYTFVEVIELRLQLMNNMMMLIDEDMVRLKKKVDSHYQELADYRVVKVRKDLLRKL